MPYDTGSIQKSLPGLLVLLGLAGLLTATVALEPPTGTLEGQVQAEAGKRPLPGALVWAVLDKPIGRDDILFRKRALTDAEGRFRFPGIPAGGYHLSVHARGYWPGSKYDIIVGSDRVKATMPIPMQARSPELSVWASGSAERKDYPFITLTGYLESDTIAVSVYPFDLRGPLHSGADPRQQDLKAPTGEPALRQEVRITRTDSDGAFTRRVTLPVARPGSYLVAARSGKVSASALLLVSDLALVVKQSSRKLLVYAAHLSSGTPIRGADIEIRAQNRRIASGRTGDNGLYDMDLPRLANRKASEESSPYLVIGKHGDSLSYVFSNYWSYGGPDKCYLYTDRPIYRPSQEVHFKGILRREAGGYYTASAGRDVEVSVRDASDTQVYAKTLRTNPFGTFHDTLTLGEEPGLGSYRIIARSDGSEYYGYFEVAEYRKPEYQVAVVPAKASATVGETVRAQVRAAYYFGPPVAHARVAYTVYKSYDYYYPSQAADPWEEYYEESDTYGYGEVVQQGNAVTDGAGMALLSVPTEGEAGSSFENVKYTIEAEVTDASMKSARGTGSFMVSAGSFYIEMESDRFVAQPGEKVTLSLLARRYDGRPQGRTRIRLGIGPSDWSEEEETEGFRRAAASPLGEVTTDTNGKARFSFKAGRAGYYRITASGEDEGRRRVERAETLWVSDEAQDFTGYRGAALEAVADKKVYERGDTARVLITSDRPNAHALISIEGEDIHRFEVLKLRGNSRLIAIPIEDRFVPNVFVSVCVVAGRELFQREVRLNVSPRRRILNVTVRPDRALYRPGEKATYRIVTADVRGRPVPAEVSLAVVDEAIFALREETARDIRKFFWGPRPNRVNTNYSFPDFYPGGPDKFGFAGRVRKYFPDTAFWSADIVTDRRGRAKVSFTVPDSLTTWRATARAVTYDTLVGQQAQKVIASQELLVRLQTPRFFTQGDQLMVSALVHNYTSRDQRVNVRLAAEGIALSDQPDRSILVKRQGMEQLSWHVRADRAGEARLSVYAKGETASDAMELPVPVIPHGIERRWSHAGTVEKAVRLAVPLPSEAVSGTARLTVRLAPSFASAMLGTLDYLATYPYGCMEQTMSAFVPDIIASRVLKDLGLPPGPDAARLPEMIAKGLQKIYRMQREDGSWGWTELDAADPFMTAWAVDGLAQARQAGYRIDDTRLHAGVRALENLLRESYRSAGAQGASGSLAQSGPDMRAYIVYALSQAGAASYRQLDAVFRSRDSLSHYARALLALAYSRSGSRSRAYQAMADLKRRAIVTENECHWESKSWRSAWTDDDIEATAFALQALARIMPGDPLIDKAVRWLLYQRTGDHWVSTKQSAAVVYAFAEVLRRSVLAEPPAYTASLTVNGRPAGRMEVTPDNALRAERAFEVPASLLHRGGNEILITKDGEGTLAYSAALSFVAAEDPIRPAGEGFTVSRAYARLVPRLDAASGVAYLPEPLDGESRTGEMLQVTLRIRSGETLRYMVIEDYLPGGCEPMAQTEAEAAREEVQESRPPAPKEPPRLWGRRETRDERVSFLCQSIPKGESAITYRLRAVLPGRYVALPARGAGMYRPEARANSGESALIIR